MIGHLTRDQAEVRVVCLALHDITPCSVCRAKARSSSGCESHPATVAPAGSNRSSRGGNEAAEAFDVRDPVGGSASMQALT